MLLAAASDTLDYELVVNFMGLFIPLTTGEGCRSLTQGQCPATPNNRFSYVLDYTVPPLPDVRVHCRFEQQLNIPLFISIGSCICSASCLSS